MWLSPISPSNSALGTRAATESTTSTSICPEVINALLPAQRALLESDIAAAFRAAFLAIAAFAALGMLIAWSIPARRL